jgi:malate dehydrogenase
MKVVIKGGAGGVGSSAAFNLLLSGVSCDVVLVDSRPDMITSHVMDLEQTLTLGAGRSVRGGDNSDLIDADVVVVCASAPLRLNNSRLEFLFENAPIIEEVCDHLSRAGRDWPGALIIVTNPVDPLCALAQRRTGIDRRRVIGYTINDCLRLRTGIGKVLDVAPASIDAWVIGEHGDCCVPLFSRVKVNGVPVALSAEQQNEAEEFLRSWYPRHVALNSGRSSTWTSGLGVARMVASIAQDRKELMPASIVLAGEYGIEGVSLSVPVTLGRQGVDMIHEWSLTPKEQEGLRFAALQASKSTDAIICRRV